MPATAGSPLSGARPSALSRELIDELYDFALTTTWDPRAAEDAVREALAQVDPAVATPAQLFERVRMASIPRAVSPDSVVVDVNEELPAPADLPVAMLESIALPVLDGLPPGDRAVLDLALRRGIDGDDLATALDLPPSKAPNAVKAAQGRADRLLGHYVLARIGHDTCPRLREALGDPPPDRLDALARRVEAHLEECSLCTDRRLSLSPVTSMLDAIPPRPAPDALHEAVGHLWKKEDVEAEQAARQRRRWAGLVAIVLVVALAGSLIGIQLLTNDSESQVNATATTLAPLLRAESSTVELGLDETEGTAVVRNIADRSVDYRVEVDVPWLAVSPLEGSIPVGGDAELAFTLDRVGAPEGAIVTTLRVIAGGTTTEIDIAAEIPRGPEILGVLVDPPGLVPDGCSTAADRVSTARLSATVDSVAPLTSVIANTPAGPIPMSQSEGGAWSATLGPFENEGTVTVSVVATDAVGKIDTSVELRVGVDACPAPPTTTRRRR